MKTYSLEAAVEQICGPDSGMKDPRSWVLRQIRRGRFQALKVGRHYRMTAEQIEAAVESLSTGKPAPKPEPSERRELSLTATSARRLRTA